MIGLTEDLLFAGFYLDTRVVPSQTAAAGVTGISQPPDEFPTTRLNSSMLI